MSDQKTDNNAAPPERDPLPWTIRELQDLYLDEKEQKKIGVSNSRVSLRLAMLYLEQIMHHQQASYNDIVRAIETAWRFAAEEKNESIQYCASGLLTFAKLIFGVLNKGETIESARKSMFANFAKAGNSNDAYVAQALSYIGYAECPDNEFNVDRAIKFFEKAAKQGDIFAQFFLGMIYNGIPPFGAYSNLEKAERYYLQAANQGYAVAWGSLFELYYRKRTFTECAICARNAKLLQKDKLQPVFTLGSTLERFDLKNDKKITSAADKFTVEYADATLAACVKTSEKNLQALFALQERLPGRFATLRAQDESSQAPEVATKMQRMFAAFDKYVEVQEKIKQKNLEKKGETELTDLGELKERSERFKEKHKSQVDIDSKAHDLVSQFISFKAAGLKAYQAESNGKFTVISEAGLIEAATNIEGLIKQLSELQVEGEDAEHEKQSYQRAFTLQAKKFRLIAEGDQTEETLEAALSKNEDEKKDSAITKKT